MIDKKGLAVLYMQAGELSSKATLTPQEQRKYNLLLSQISMLKTGEVTLQDLDQESVNEIERKHGLPESRLNPTRLNAERRGKAEAWKLFIDNEGFQKRAATQGEGAILSRIGTYSGLGSFVPTEFLTEVFTDAAAHDALLDEDSVTVLETTNGRPIAVPTYGDIAAVASVLAENADSTSSEVNLTSPGHSDVGVYSYRSPMWRISAESFQDIETVDGAMGLFKSFTADRIARGVAKHLTVGNGTGQPLGLVPSLIVGGVTPIIASGSAANTGGSETGTNTIGSADLAKLYASVNPAYRNNEKTAWFMNDSTRGYLAAVVTKQGVPLINWYGGDAFILGKPVKICPSMDNLGNGTNPIVFGDGAYWMTRIVMDDATYVQAYRERYAELGQVGLRMFVRAGGALLHNDPTSPLPFGLLQMHS
ncbi:MAG: phage major capsid protein [Acidobacteriota bacterium]|nr:phage major capsid protein [Acidobacteriota bacterium]